MLRIGIVICVILAALLPVGRLETYRVTAYCSGKCCCGEYSDGITASGHTIEKGDRFVAAPPELAFGTMILIPGYNDSKPVEVRDRGSAIQGNRLDVFFGGKDGHERAKVWGVQKLEIEIISRSE